MKGFRINDDAGHVAKIVSGIAKKEGHCPCRIDKNETTLCPCDEFVSQGICKCNLFIKLTAKENSHEHL